MIGRGLISLSKGAAKKAVSRASFSSVVANGNLCASAATPREDKCSNKTRSQIARSMSNYHPLASVSSTHFPVH